MAWLRSSFARVAPVFALVGVVVGCSGGEPPGDAPTPPPSVPVSPVPPPTPSGSVPPSPEPAKPWGPPGTLDTTFGDRGWTASLGEVYARRLRTFEDGSFVVAGTKALQPSSDLVIARFDADGRPVRTFGVDGVVTLDLLGGSTDSAADMFVENGRLWVVATARTPNTGWSTWLIALDRDGKPDTTFAPQGRKVISDESETGNDAALLRPEGLLVLHTKFDSWKTTLVRYDRAGVRDATFPARTVSGFTNLSSCNGRVFAHQDGFWKELDPSGSEVPPGIGIPTNGYRHAHCTDRHVVWLGTGFQTSGGGSLMTDHALAFGRVGLDGNRDTSWGTEQLFNGTYGFQDSIVVEAMTTDGQERLLFVESRYEANNKSPTSTALRRSTADGKSIDRTFGADGRASSKPAQLLTVARDRRILVVTGGLSVGRYFP